MNLKVTINGKEVYEANIDTTQEAEDFIEAIAQAIVRKRAWDAHKSQEVTLDQENFRRVEETLREVERPVTAEDVEAYHYRQEDKDREAAQRQDP